MKHLFYILTLFITKLAISQNIEVSWSKPHKYSDIYMIEQQSSDVFTCMFYEENRSRICRFKADRVEKEVSLAFTSKDGKKCNFEYIGILGENYVVIYSAAAKQKNSKLIYVRFIDPQKLQIGEERILDVIPPLKKDAITYLNYYVKGVNLYVLKTVAFEKKEKVPFGIHVYGPNAEKINNRDFILDDTLTNLSILHWNVNPRYLVLAIDITRKLKGTSYSDTAEYATQILIGDINDGTVKKISLYAPEIKIDNFNAIQLLFNNDNDLLILAHWGFRFMWFKYDFTSEQVTYKFNLPQQAMLDEYAKTQEANVFTNPTNWLFFLNSKILSDGSVITVAHQKKIGAESVGYKTIERNMRHYGGIVCYKYSPNGVLQWCKYVSRELRTTSESVRSFHPKPVFLANETVILYNKTIFNGKAIAGKDVNHLGYIRVSHDGNIVSGETDMPKPKARMDITDVLDLFLDPISFFDDLKKEVFFYNDAILTNDKDEILFTGSDGFVLLIGKIKMSSELKDK
jgi:hypothetical protein